MSAISHDGLVAFWTENPLIKGITLVFAQGHHQNGSASQLDRLRHHGPDKRNRISNRLPKLIDPHTRIPYLETMLAPSSRGRGRPGSTDHNSVQSWHLCYQANTSKDRMDPPYTATVDHPCYLLYHLVHKLLIRRHIRPHALKQKDRRICGN